MDCVDDVLYPTQFRKVNGVWQRRRWRKDSGTWHPWLTLHLELKNPARGEARYRWSWRSQR